MSRARRYVEGFLGRGEDAGKTPKDEAAALRLLREKAEKRHDPFSKELAKEARRAEQEIAAKAAGGSA